MILDVKRVLLVVVNIGFNISVLKLNNVLFRKLELFSVIERYGISVLALNVGISIVLGRIKLLFLFGVVNFYVLLKILYLVGIFLDKFRAGFFAFKSNLTFCVIWENKLLLVLVYKIAQGASSAASTVGGASQKL